MGRAYPLAFWPQGLITTGTVMEAAPAAMERQRLIRSSYGVHFYSGRNGTGKSGWMIYDTLPDLEAGRTVLSTVRLLDYSNPRECEGWVRGSVKTDERTDCPVCKIPGARAHAQAHPSYVPFTDWPQLLDLGTVGWAEGGQDSVCLMDEITGVADSNESAAMPAMVGNELAQLRRAGVVLRISGLNFIRASKRIREACVGVTRCESFIPYDVFDDNGRAKIWRPRRLTVARTYDAKSLPLDDIKESHWEEADLIAKSRAWIQRWDAIRAYDTLAPVDRVGGVSDAGACVHCYGSRTRHPCVCPDYVQEKERRKAAGPQGRSPRTPRPAAVPVPAGV